MERLERKPLQGTMNIIRFNWHFYVLALASITGLLLLYPHYPSTLIIIAIAAAAITTFTSLAVSCYIYDFTELYRLNWLGSLNIKAGSRLVNINAGFDETSALLAQKYPKCKLTVLDFYEPARHTEVSIERARKAYPAHSGTIKIQTTEPLLKATSADFIFLIFAAHEIRDTKERVLFLKNLKASLSNNGRIIIVEHLRDLPNLIAYNIGAFHFLPQSEWDTTFKRAELTVESKTNFTPFISIYTLKSNGITS